jgi:hypothetical protein
MLQRHHDALFDRYNIENIQGLVSKQVKSNSIDLSHGNTTPCLVPSHTALLPCCAPAVLSLLPPLAPLCPPPPSSHYPPCANLPSPPPRVSSLFLPSSLPPPHATQRVALPLYHPVQWPLPMLRIPQKMGGSIETHAPLVWSASDVPV